MRSENEMECQLIHSEVKLQTGLLPREIVIIIYKFADITTKFKMINVFKWLLNIKMKN